MLKNKNRGQSIIEYSMLIMIIIAVLLSVGNYFKRGVQGRWKASVDELGDQYNPKTATGTIIHTIDSNANTNVWAVDLGGGSLQTFRTDSAHSKETKIGSMLIPAE